MAASTRTSRCPSLRRWLQAATLFWLATAPPAGAYNNDLIPNPALEAGGHSESLVGYFISDTGPLHQLIHLWRFEDDATRRAFWANLFSDEAFMAFAGKLRPNIARQEIQLLQPAPWGPNP